MKLKNVLLTLGLALGVGAAIGTTVAQNMNTNLLETKATAAAYHVVTGWLNGVNDTVEIGEWNEDSNSFSWGSFLRTNDWFRIRVGNSDSDYKEFYPSDLSAEEQALISDSGINESHFQPKEAGYYNFTFTSESVSLQFLPEREYNYYTANDIVYIQKNYDWDLASPKFALYYFNNEDTHRDWSPFFTDANLTDDGYYKFVFPDSMDWHADKMIFVRFSPSASNPGWSDVWTKTGDLVAQKGTNCIWLTKKYDGGNLVNGEGGFFLYTEVTYYFKADNNEPVDASLYLTNQNQVYAELSVEAGEQIYCSNNGVDYFAIGGEDKYSNNLSSGGVIKAEGTITLFVNRDDWSTSWATGYAPSTTTLQNFCDYLLSNTINDGVCSVSNEVAASLQAMYAGTYGDTAYDLTGGDVDEFESFDPAYGMNQSYDSVVHEALTRYCMLVKDGKLTNFAGIDTVKLGSVGTIMIGQENNQMIIIALCGVMILAAAGGFFFLRRRKEN